MSYDDAVRFLTGRINFERTRAMPYRSRRLKLQRMQQLLDRLGGPQDRLRIVHIAGTKGKGSTAATLSSLLRAAGYRTGLFTSPHIERLEERFQVDDAICGPDELIELVEHVRPAVDAMDAAGEQPTFFEVANAIAYLHFLRNQVDWVVLEVGLGGRLDSTNVCRPRLTIITNISLDHTRQLGRTLSQIAGEKAGIIKPQVPVISGETGTDAAEVIRETAATRQSPLYRLGKEYQVTYHVPEDGACEPLAGTIDLSWCRDVRLPARQGLRLAMAGRHQANNASLAVAAFDMLHAERPLSIEVLQRGLLQVNCPGRIQVMASHPLVLLDGAHNVASARALAEVLRGLARRPTRHLFFTGTLGKDVGGMLTQLLPWFDRVVISRYADNPRAMDPADLFRCAVAMARRLDRAASVQHAPDGESATIERLGDRPLEISWRADGATGWRLFQSRVGHEDLACITGSFFFLAEARRLIESAGWMLDSASRAPLRPAGSVSPLY